MKNKKQFLVGRKVGMTQLINEAGKVNAVTVIEAYENEIVGIRTLEKDGYSAVRVGFKSVKKDKLNKPNQGQFKSGSSFKSIKEFRVEDSSNFELNSKVDLATLKLIQSMIYNQKQLVEDLQVLLKLGIIREDQCLMVLKTIV